MQILTLILALLSGVALGTLFFGGLWWTVRAVIGAPRGALYMLGSLLLRMGVCAVGFCLVAHGKWPSMLACLLGFLLARTVVLRLSAPWSYKRRQHAP